jgi:ubiquitin-protein ligase
MATLQEQRRARLKNDHNEMSSIRGSTIEWEPLRGSPPFLEAYKLDIEVRTIIGPGPRYRDEHEVKVVLPPNYPASAPQTQMTTRPQPFHPNWYQSGRWCCGRWNASESLGRHIIRMIRTLQFAPEITDPRSPANSEAGRWYRKHKSKGLFPCDTQSLPDPTTSGFKVRRRTDESSGFRVRRRTDK